MFLAQQKQITQQDEQLENQKRHFDAELNIHEAEQKEQQEQFRLQHESIKRQNFESSFFQLLNLQRELQTQLQTDTIVTDKNGIKNTLKTVHGKECFRVFRDDINTQYRANRARARLIASEFPNEEEHVPSETEQALIAYTQVYNAQQQQLAHYFRNLYHIFKFVATSDIADKRRYTSLVRAQLSAYELAVLFYNAVSPHGEGFKKYVEAFGLLEHLNEQLLLDPSHADNKDFYADCAYK